MLAYTLNSVTGNGHVNYQENPLACLQVYKFFISLRILAIHGARPDINHFDSN